MILAAAIKFHIDTTDSDVVLCGYRHGNIFEQLKLLGFEAHKGYKEIEQGFIDHNGKFLNRKEALQHAIVCGQLCEKIANAKTNGKDFPQLISEDLW